MKAGPTPNPRAAQVAGRVAAAQQRLMAALKLHGAAPAAGDYVRVADAALQADAVVGVRREDEPPLTGWQIEPATLPIVADAPHGEYQLHELAALRPAWIAALALPPGWSFRCVGREIVDAVAPDGTRHVLTITVEA